MAGLMDRWMDDISGKLAGNWQARFVPRDMFLFCQELQSSMPVLYASAAWRKRQVAMRSQISECGGVVPSFSLVLGHILPIFAYCGFRG